MPIGVTIAAYAFIAMMTLSAAAIIVQVARAIRR